MIFKKTKSRIEEDLGLNYYSTPQIHINGKIKSKAEDFVVQEILKNHIVLPLHKSNHFCLPLTNTGNYIRAILVKNDLDTLSSIKLLSQRLKIPFSYFNYLGLKDAKALTSQLISFPYNGASPLISSNDIKLLYAACSSIPVKSHELWGNRFNVTIHVPSPSSYDELLKKLSFLIKYISSNGVIAYFGHQRFGTTKPYTYEIGRAIVKDDFEKAVNLVLSSKIGRQITSKTISHNFASRHLIFERSVFESIKQNGSNYIRAFKFIPKQVQRLFIHSYQSYLFNRIVSRRISLNLPLDEALIGDLVGFPRSGSVMLSDVFEVNASNVDKVNRYIKRGVLTPVYPILGYGTKHLPKKAAGEPILSILGEEKIRGDDFHIQQLPYLSAKGYYRPLIFNVHALSISNSRLSSLGASITLRFELRKGFYATIVLREIIKATNILSSGF